MKESRNLLEVAIEVSEELKTMKNYITKIVTVIKEDYNEKGVVTTELYNIGIEFCTQDFKYLETYHEKFCDILEQIVGRREFDYEKTLSCFEEFLDQLEAVFTFIKANDST